MQIAKVSEHDDAQSVRLPRHVRVHADELVVKQVGSAIVLFPKDEAWNVLERAIQDFPPDFMADREQPGEPDERPNL